MTAHDPLCARPIGTMDRAGCPTCILIEGVRLDQIERCLAVVDKGGRAEQQLRTLLEDGAA